MEWTEGGERRDGGGVVMEDVDGGEGPKEAK